MIENLQAKTYINNKNQEKQAANNTLQKDNMMLYGNVSNKQSCKRKSKYIVYLETYFI